jgi:hypothetical protein
MTNETDIQGRAGRELKIEACNYVCPVTGDKWKSDAYTVVLSDALTYSPDKNLVQVIELVPEGHRLSALEEMKYVAQECAKLKSAGVNPRDVLKDPMFERFIFGNPYKWQHTGVLLIPPNGADNFTKYTEKDKQGRHYSRTDIYLSGKDKDGVIKKKKIADGALMPHGKGLRVEKINPVIGIPASVFIDVSDESKNHVMHSYFEPKLNEIEVALDGGWYRHGDGRCLSFYADFGPSFSNSAAAFRAVQGSVDDVIAPVFEPFVKDKGSYEKGIVAGRKEGIEEGRKLGKQEAIEEFSVDLNDILRKYSARQ